MALYAFDGMWDEDEADEAKVARFSKRLGDAAEPVRG